MAGSATVAASAQAYAESCPASHSNSPQGENILLTNYAMPLAHLVAAWYDEAEL